MDYQNQNQLNGALKVNVARIQAEARALAVEAKIASELFSADAISQWVPSPFGAWNSGLNHRPNLPKLG